MLMGVGRRSTRTHTIHTKSMILELLKPCHLQVCIAEQGEVGEAVLAPRTHADTIHGCTSHIVDAGYHVDDHTHLSERQRSMHDRFRERVM